MKVWRICERHDSQEYPGTNRSHCWRARGSALLSPCDIVEMQLVPLDARVVEGADDAISVLESLGLMLGPLTVEYDPRRYGDRHVVVIPENYPEGPKDLDNVAIRSGDLVDIVRFRLAALTSEQEGL